MSGLFRAQAELQAEADALVRELGLDELLGILGQPIRVGSSAMGLMVRRDIDITVVCPKLDAQTLADLGGIAQRLMQLSTAVSAVRFRNDCGAWNSDPHKYPDGLYLGLTVRASDGAMWTFDIWVVDQPDRQPDLRHIKTLLPRITDEHRKAILEIKRTLAARPSGAESISSSLVYEAVTDHGIQTAEQFERWHRDRSS